MTETKKNTPEYQQKILFGCPGTGKSHKVDNETLEMLGVEKGSDDLIKCVFHPEYSCGDFMGKLMPLTQGDKVTYHYYPGHFLQALARAYKNINEAEPTDKAKPVCLVIDEINRGNTAAIFGSVIQLLDRENGTSSYRIRLSKMELDSLIHSVSSTAFDGDDIQNLKDNAKVSAVIQKLEKLKPFISLLGDVKLPPNLSIIGTMNTSDESIYYMDSAFKRRWDWEYINLTDEIQNGNLNVGETTFTWSSFVDKLNAFIKDQAGSIRRVEDKQIGYWFIKANCDGIITKAQIKNKLMFFLWDSVFQRDKKPLKELIFGKGSTKELVTFGDFTALCDDFISKVLSFEDKRDGKSGDSEAAK